MLPHEAFLWQCARKLHEPDKLVIPPALDGPALVSLALKNKAQTLLHQALVANRDSVNLPPEAARALERGVNKHTYLAAHLGAALRSYLAFAAESNQEVVVIKGLWLCEKVYGNPAMRPGADIDLLLRRRHIPDSIRILEEQMGYGSWWRPLLDDRYYARHHLHQQRCNADRSIWIEPHWLLDHPYTQLTIDYDAMFDRARPGKLWDLPVRELSWPDLLISLCIHLVKHAVYLPFSLERDDLAQLILADGMLMYFLDVAEVVRRAGDNPPWSVLVDAANNAGAGAIVASTLTVCSRLLDTPVPEDVLSRFHRPAADPITLRLMTRLGDAELGTYHGQPPSGLWAFLLGYNAAIVFRPIRLLDLVHYLWPEKDFLRRRYGSMGFSSRTAHLLRACGQYLLVGFDTVRYTLQRKMEVRQLDREGFEWPPPPVDPFTITQGEHAFESAQSFAEVGVSD